MNYFLISFRKEYTKTCLRSCRCYEGGNDSSLKFYYTSDYDSLLKILIERISEDKEAEYINVVVTRWEDMEEIANYGYAESDYDYVHVACRYTDYDAEGWADEHQYCDSMTGLENKIRVDIRSHFKGK